MLELGMTKVHLQGLHVPQRGRMPIRCEEAAAVWLHFNRGHNPLCVQLVHDGAFPQIPDAAPGALFTAAISLAASSCSGE